MASFGNAPYTPQKFWAWSPKGVLITAFADRFAFEMIGPSVNGNRGMTTLRRWSPAATIVSVRRETPRVPVGADERELLRARLPAGVVVPPVKPAFRAMHVGADGQILIMVSMPSERSTVAPSRDAGARAASTPTIAFMEPTVFDIFSSDGIYEGRVGLPVGARYMQSSGDQIWCVVRDNDGVEIVKRYKIRW
jgi:hypothetical protein